MGPAYIKCSFTENALFGLTLLPTFKNVVFSSNDFGQTIQTDTLADPVEHLYFFNPSLGFAFGQNGVIYKTANGGGITNIESTGHLERKLSVFPNPAKNNVEVKTAENIVIQSIRLSDIYGKLVKEQKGNRHRLDIENISAGNYLLEIKTNKGTFTDKLVIRK
jgi:hypothetical protein